MRLVSGREAPPGLVVDRYRIETELGRGGLGTVFRANEVATARVVALKMLDDRSERATALFEREYHVLASLKHPSVIEVYDFSMTSSGKRFYTMELLPGTDLLDASPLPWHDACRHVRDIAASLSLLHGRRLLHRDVSPRNIRFDAKGRAKLLDFGALTTFGVPSEIVGTPMCTAPEVVRQVELDQRADLFSLGVVLYFALTKQRPFVIRSLKEVEAVVAIRPLPPSQYAPELPLELDQLVLSMLSADPIGRPSTAAEVMERLSAIAELGDDPDSGVAESHLLSTSFCGRERELSQLKLHVQNATQGEGGVVVVESSTGMGKTRLLSELLIAARLAGMTTLRVDAAARSEPLGVMRAVASLLMEKAPAEATETLAPHLPVLWQAIPEAFPHVRAPSKPPLGLPEDRHERRARIQHHFVRWLLEVAARRPLLLAVDDAHATDLTSAGVLAELAHMARSTRLLLVTTELIGSETPIAIRQLARIGARIRLRELSLETVGELVDSAFGDVPNRTRLTQWLFDVGHGNPGQSVALLQHLLEKGFIRYAQGAWVLPADLADADLPASVGEVLGAQVRSLTDEALLLARLLAVHRGPMVFAFGGANLAGMSRGVLFMALSELQARGMIVSSGEAHRLADEALRAMLLDGLGEPEIRTLHLELGQALAGSLSAISPYSASIATLPQLVRALQGGYHLSEGGDDAGGSEYLFDAAIELTHRGDGLVETVPALETALRSRTQRHQRALILTPLTLAGHYSDFHLTYRYGDEVMEILTDISGLALAARLRRFLGSSLALAIAIVFAFVRFVLIGRGARSHGYGEMVLGVISMAPAIIGVAVPVFDRELARRTLASVEILGYLPESLPPRLVYEFCRAMTDATAGDYALTRNRAKEVLARLHAPGGVRHLPETARVQLELGVLVLVGSLDTYRTDGALHETLELMERLETAYAEQVAAGLRAVYHAHRGERTGFEKHQDIVDALAARAGSTWRQDVLIARNLWWPHFLCEDVMALKHVVRQLDALVKDTPSLGLTRDAAHACYLVARGMHVEALARYGRVLEAVLGEPNELNMRIIGTLARIYRLNGMPERAEAICRTTLDSFTKEQGEFDVLLHGARLERVLALFEVGWHDEAFRAVRSLLDEQERHDNPMIRGLTHQAAARMALETGDATEFRTQLDAMDQWFRRTDNPSLVAQCYRLADEGQRAGLLPDAREYVHTQGSSTDVSEAMIRQAFGRCRGAGNRVATALEIVVGATQAERGYLYLSEKEGGLRFAAPLVGHEPPDELRIELSATLDAFCREEDVQTVIVDAAEPEGMATLLESEQMPSDVHPGASLGYSAVYLLLPKGERLVAVGAVALIAGDRPLIAMAPRLLEEVARGIYEAADVQTVFLGKSTGRSSQRPSAPAGAPPAALSQPPVA